MIQIAGFYPKLIPSLEDATWAFISDAASSGKAANYWEVGDTKTISFGSAVWGSSSITVMIMGFDYDDLAAGGKAPITFGMVDCFATTQKMNSTNTNEGGWGSCELRSSLISTILPALVGVIGSGIIKPVTKRTSAGNGSSNIVTTTDSAWLFSRYEVDAGGLNEKPADKSISYPAFTNNASRIKKAGASNTLWWLRSPYLTDAFRAVSSAGAAASSGGASNKNGVAVGFCV